MREELSRVFPADRMEKILCLDVVDSTNNKLKELAQEGAEQGQVVIADGQTAGKGRRGRSFASPSGKGIYLSYLLKPERMSPELATLTAWTAVAVRRAVHTVCGAGADIKWVNDLVLNQKKICGILTEMAVGGTAGCIHHVVIGIGINVNELETDFPEEVRTVATSLRAELGKTFPREQLAGEIIRELDRLCLDFPVHREMYLEEYRKSCITTGKEVCVISGTKRRKAKALQVVEDFSLEVEYEDGARELVSSGEVSVRGVEGYV